MSERSPGSSAVLARHFNLTTEDARTCGNYAFRNACQNGHLATARWLVTHFGLTVDDVGEYDNYALRQATENGHLQVVQWLSDFN